MINQFKFVKVKNGHKIVHGERYHYWRSEGAVRRDWATSGWPLPRRIASASIEWRLSQHRHPDHYRHCTHRPEDWAKSVRSSPDRRDAVAGAAARRRGRRKGSPCVWWWPEGSASLWNSSAMSGSPASAEPISWWPAISVILSNTIDFWP